MSKLVDPKVPHSEVAPDLPPEGEAALQAFLDAAFALPTDVASIDDTATTARPQREAGGLPSGTEMPLRAVNWNLLTAEEAEFEWHDLDSWVTWLRRDFGLPVQEVPPLWHRHRELVWELSALHTAWLSAYADDAPANAPLLWLRDLAEARKRLAEWVKKSGTTLSTDRPTRQTAWPGEPPLAPTEQFTITDRAADFAAFVADDLARRRVAVAAGDAVGRALADGGSR